MESLSVLNACTDCTEVEFVGFSVTSERSYQIDVLMFSSVFDERAISAQATSPPIPSQPPIADLLNFGKIQTLFLNLSQYKIFHDFMHMRAKTICEFTDERSTA